MGLLNLAIEAMAPRFDIHVPNFQDLYMPKELGLKFIPVIRADGIDMKGKPGDIASLLSMLKNPKFFCISRCA